MGGVIPFSTAESFVARVAGAGKPVRAILDTNVLIAISYEIKDSHDEVAKLVRQLTAAGVAFFATVTTRAEFMDFHRRLMLTETLVDLVDGHSRAKVPRAAADEIKKSYASVKSKQARDGSDPIFNDSQLKAIKGEFSAGPHSGHLGWLKVCEVSLRGYVEQVEKQLADAGITYLSPNEPSQRQLFNGPLEWPAAASLVERTGLSVSDAMILNALNRSACQFAVSMDFDFGFAVMADQSNKDVVMPDSIEREYRHYHFGKES
ncbi:MAG: hypothetical protein AB7G93_16485 [Bdellovibrionales bacterium]